MEEIRTGMLAKSKAGHDKGQVYVIMDTDDAYVYLADGRIRTLGRLKKKKKKAYTANQEGVRCDSSR